MRIPGSLSFRLTSLRQGYGGPPKLQRRRKWITVRAVLVMLAVVGLLVSRVATHVTSAATQPPAGQEEFVPIDQLPQDEELPAAPLVIAAYAIAWLAVFGYLWSIWQRTSRVERDLAELSRRVHAGGERR